MADDPSRLEMISTRWTLLEQAHRGADGAAAARTHLLERYGGAVRRYLRGAAKDPDAADDLFQEFAYRFLHGDFKGASPERGRFRDFLKGVISHLVADFCRRQGRRMVNLPEGFAEPMAPVNADADQAFMESWRDELLAQSWKGLAEMETLSGQPYHTVLRFRADHPDLRSAELASQLAEKLERRLTAAGVRQQLHRAREKFAEILRQRVLASLSSDVPDELNQELQDLGLLAYVRT
jgi:RNA polymerase sigma-70 factor (ECF subfamily)